MSHSDPNDNRTDGSDTKYDFSGIEKPWEDEDILRYLYIEEGLSMKDVGDVLGCSVTPIHKNIHEYDIKPRKQGGNTPVKAPELRDKEILRELYHEDGLTQEEIAQKFDVSQSLVTLRIGEAGLDLSPDEAGEKSGQSRRDEGPHFFTSDGYECVSCTVGPYETHQVKIHRLLAVAEYGFDAVKGNVIHHKNHIPWDNRSENIEPMSNSEHVRYHRQIKLGNKNPPWISD